MVVTVIPGHAAVVACLDVVGLASLETARQRKEIGSGVLDATPENNMVLLSKEFALLFTVALVVTVPLPSWR